ncbi:PREDICTED: uncharacterized protein LOC105448376 [Wasmannia auropunctata]|uniref:uncharacterized protein LOC105448376 n=1 Tax=Wasmannia auropunctata TaxID=64793 RepID=UPI0005F028E6|nr:PREDICTED: uncharacterized protein LOC105448376 [Wasmannia auropunctata]
MEQLLSAQAEIHGRIGRTVDNLKKMGAANVTAAAIESCLKLLDAKWTKAEEQHSELCADYGDKLEKHEYIANDFISEIEALYIQQRATLMDFGKALGASAPAQTTRPPTVDLTVQRTTLPQIPLPEFSGRFEDWPTYRDLFESLVIDEKSLSNIKKFQYLKGSVKGDALQLITSLPVTADNFTRAWATLNDHYENKRLLLKSYLAAFTSLQKMKSDSVADLKRIFHRVVTTVGALEGIGRPITGCADLFVHLVIELLDDKTHREWEDTLTKKSEPPSYEKLRDFLEEQVLKQESFRPREQNSSGRPSERGRAARTYSTKKQGYDVASRHCPLCKRPHFIMVCEQYKLKSAREKREVVSTYRLCENCLGRHHVTDCPSPKHCGKCTARHHTTLHDAYASALSALAAPDATAAVHVSDSPPVDCAPVLLATARVLVTDRAGERHTVRALVDSGSETCMIAESLAQRLRLPRTPTSVAIFGIGGQQTGVSRGRISLTLASRTSGLSLEISALVFPHLTVYGGVAARRPRSWLHLEGLELADPEFLNQDPIELLLGADVFAHIALPGLRKGGPLEPIAQQTQLGWVILGAAGLSHAASVMTSLQCSPLEELNSLVRQFWEQEEPPHAPLPLSDDEHACEDHFVRTHKRDPSGRYQVRLPVRATIPDLSGSRRAASRMLDVMQRRFKKDPIFRDKYHVFLREYSALGHMSFAVPLAEGPSVRVCFLPHHGVLKGSGSDAKIRVVFNGSSQTMTGTSLNDFLRPGPNLLPALTDVIIRWRHHRFVFITDIEKMYRQIMVHPEDRNLQRILWEENGETLEFRLNTVTYGLSCAPYLAIRVLRQLANDEERNFPLGAEALRRDAYVDDILSGASTLAETRNLQGELSQLCTAGGFPLRKWAANHPALLEDIPLDHRSQKPADTVLPAESQSVLGLRWSPEGDSFAPIVGRTATDEPTKRSLLSYTARLFDPFGWLAPIIVLAKLLIQSTWLQRLDWDDHLAGEERAAWQRLTEEMPLLQDIRIPRWMHSDSARSQVEIHGFSDASERAYGAVIYLRAAGKGRVHTSLVLAKTKVAPLKRVSLPRLELCAATLLAKLASHVKTTLPLEGTATHLWTDSTVTLGWIRGHPAKWTTFVANRVAEIHRNVADVHWHHVPGRDNPADCASRGMSPRDLLVHSLWWRGPTFLSEDPSQWPVDPGTPATMELPEQRVGSCLPVSEILEPEELTRFSSLKRLLRVSAWMWRWRARPDMVDPASCRETTILTTDELEQALHRWLRVVQSIAFRAELDSIAQRREMPPRGPLRRLTPAVDAQGLLRVGGRLKHSVLDADQRHPIILPPGSHLTYLVIDATHHRTLHGGTQATLAAIRQRYWIPKGRQLVRRYIHRCVRCARWRAASPQPLMGSLPKARVTPSRPFLHTGVDFAGPILLRTTKGRGHKAYKAYLAVFICFSSRAVHLEVVSDYSAEAFLAAFRRFVSRRGLCQAVYSDCGTNFVGADSQLRALFQAAGQECHRIVGSLASDGVQWHFNPPSAPHFGGLWEAAVKSLKHHLRRVIGETTLTYEEMATLLAEVEACLNSRPLQALTDDPEDLTALTPGHFLVGAPLNSIPEPALLDIPANRLSRWRLLQSMRDHLWHRWAQEYLQGLAPRPKWWRTTGNLKEGQLCLVKSEVTPPSRWSLARITRIHLGEDGQVRVVEVRTAAGQLTRPVVKIVPLLSADEGGTSA